MGLHTATALHIATHRQVQHRAGIAGDASQVQLRSGSWCGMRRENGLEKLRRTTNDVERLIVALQFCLWLHTVADENVCW